MPIDDPLSRFRAEAFKRIGDAARVGKVEEVNRLAAIVKDCDAAMALSQRLEAEKQRISTALAPEAQPIDKQSMSVAEASSNDFISPQISPRARAKDFRMKWIASTGLNLRRKGEVIFETVSGRSVGIPYARELEDHPDLWFLGLPDENFDLVVLLCEGAHGEVLDFVLPPEFVRAIWRSLARDGNHHVKFHLTRTGVNYALRLRGSILKEITGFRGKTSTLS
jgi:hypothetical protein